MHSDVLTIERSGAFALLTLNRPKELNAINTDLLAALEEALDAIRAEKSIAAVILAGAGEKAFCAGADVQYMVHMDPIAAKHFSETGHRVMRKLASLPCLTIAAINGYAFGGGCELALACDIRVATPKSLFSLPEVSLGVIPGFGGTQRLPRLVGKGPAKEMLLTGCKITAERAWQIGLVNQVAEPEELMNRCTGLAQTAARNSGGAIALCKQAIDEGSEMELGQALAHETGLFALTFAQADQEERMRAFLEKRIPQYRA